MFNRLRKPAGPSAVQDLYRAVIARSREEIFYQEWRVADTIDGRFDLLTLHAFVVFDALRGQGLAAEELGSKLANVIFTGFDEALRELGISDFGMGRRIRKMADAFYGRLHHYGLAHTEPELAAAVQRNLYRGDSERAREAAGLASYMMTARACLKADVPAVLAGKPDFGPLPARLDQ
jgi:cytochrome b pre-mRNA-processing protein 3